MIYLIKREVIVLIVVILIILYNLIQIGDVSQELIEKDNKLMSFNEIELEYVRNIDDLLMYKDSDSNEYIFYDNKLIELNITDNNYNEYTLKDILDNYNINLEDYKLFKDKDEYLYIKYINDIKTEDYIHISFRDDKVKKFKTNKLGLFDNLVIDFNKDEIINMISKKYNILEDIKDIVIDYKDRYVVVCYLNNNKELIYEL